MDNSNKKHNISELSDHLFWDVDKEKISWEGNKHLIVQRVLQYGTMNDWNILKTIFGIKGIAAIAMEIRDLDPVSHNFIATISDTPKEKYRCFIERQSNPTLWNS